jgi:recombination protein RecA
VRIEIRRVESVKNRGNEIIGNRVKAKVVKNKVAPPFRVAEFDMLSSCGISLAGDVLDLATEDRIVEKSGSWFSYGENRLGQGRDKARAYLEENPQVLEEITQKVLAAAAEASTNGQESEE